MMGTDLLARLEEHGYTTTLEDKRLKVRGPAAPPPELERLIVENRDALKAAVLLCSGPPWLVKLLDRYAWSHETEVRRTVSKGANKQVRLDLGDPEEVAPAYPENLRAGKVMKCCVRVCLENVAAAVAAEVGMSAPEIAYKDGLSALVRERILPKIEAHLLQEEGEK